MTKITLYQITRHGQHITPLMGAEEAKAQLKDLEKEERQLVKLGWINQPAQYTIEQVYSGSPGEWNV